MTILSIPVELYVAYVLACTAVVIVPGPSVTVIIANSLHHGARAGLLNVAGTQAGFAVMLLILATGLQFIVESLAYVFDIIRWIGAAYLIWLGVKLLRSDGTMGELSDVPRVGGSFFWQGFLVAMSNPKVLFFFGALIPQFLTPGSDTLLQTLLLGATFIGVATTLDSSYALLAGGAGRWLSRTRVRALEVGSGLCLVCGGIWLALARR